MPQYQRPSGLIVSSAKDAGPTGRPILQELAPVSGGYDITRGLVDSLPLLPPQDSLASRSPGAHHLDIYAQVLDDWQVFSALQARRLAVCATEWEVIPGGTMRRDKQAAEHIETILAALSWDQITAQMHMGVFHGYAVAECLWQKDGAHVVPGDLRVRDARRFGFRPDGTLALLTVAHASDGEPMPYRKFWSYQTGATHADDPYGMGLAHWCYWPVQFKRGNIKLLLIALDKYASPTALGHFPANATAAEKTKLLRALEAIRSQAALILPEGMTAELLSASRSGTADYLPALNYWDQAISKVIGGHGASQDATPGRLGGEDMGRDVRSDLVTADADILNASANATWVRWVTEWSFPGAALPKVWRRMEEDEDLGQRAEREAKVYTMGFRPTLATVQDAYGGEWEVVPGSAAPGSAAPGSAGIPSAALRTGLPATGSPGVMARDGLYPGAPGGGHRDPPGVGEGTPDALAHAEPGPDAQDLIDTEAARDPGYQSAMDILLQPILEAMDQGLTPEQILARLPEWYGQMDDTALIGLLDQGVAAAEAIGRLEVQTETQPESQP